MKKKQIAEKTVAWYASFNLSGIYYSKPIEVVYNRDYPDSQGYWLAKNKRFDLYERIPLGVTTCDRHIKFVSTDKREVEMFIQGMQAVVNVARNSLFWSNQKS